MRSCIASVSRTALITGIRSTPGAHRSRPKRGPALCQVGVQREERFNRPGTDDAESRYTSPPLPPARDPHRQVGECRHPVLSENPSDTSRKATLNCIRYLGFRWLCVPQFLDKVAYRFCMACARSARPLKQCNDASRCTHRATDPSALRMRPRTPRAECRLPVRPGRYLKPPEYRFIGRVRLCVC